MVKFNELRITPDGKHLIIDASIKDEEYYTNVVIDSIVIDNQDTFLSSGPSNKPIFTYTVTEKYDNIYALSEYCNCNPVLADDKSYCFIYDEKGAKNIRLILSSADMGVNLQDNMLFVYVITSGTPAPNTPCGMDNYYTLGTAIYLYSIYQNTIKHLHDLNECEIPKCLIDSILRIKAIELSVKTGNYPMAIKYWNKWIKGISNTNISNCNCYERIN